MGLGNFNVDFSNVEEFSGGIPAGTYICKVRKIEKKEGKQYPYLMWTLVIGLGEHKKKKIIERTSFSPKALFKLKQVLEGLGFPVPKGAMNITPDAYIGKLIGVVCIDSEYKDSNGVMKPTYEISEYFTPVKTNGVWGRKPTAKAEDSDIDLLVEGMEEIPSPSIEDDAIEI